MSTRAESPSRASYKAALAQLKAAHGTAKAAFVTRAQIAALHAKQADSPYAANRALATWSKLFVWGMSRGFVPRGDNPAREIDRYRESKNASAFSPPTKPPASAMRSRLGETVGLPYVVDENEAEGAKHAAKVENRLVKLDPFAVAAIRLLILTGARLREILDAEWSRRSI